MAARDRRLLLLLAPLLVFLIVAAVYWSSPAAQIGGDTALSIPLSRSILYEHDLDLDEYRPLRPADAWKVTAVGPHIYSFFPTGASLLAAPFVALHDVVGAVSNQGIQLSDAALERASAAIITALASVLVYLIARRSLTLNQSLLVAFLFAFCTSAWSTASRVLWQHAPSVLALSLALFLILLAEDRPWMIQFAGIPVAFSFVSRPTNAISVIILTLFVALRRPRYFLQYILWASLVAVPFVVFNWQTYHSLLAPYYQLARIGGASRFWEALAGNLVSPGRGLLTFSPVLLFCAYGVFLKIKGFRGARSDLLLDVLLLLAIVLHWLVVSAFPHWWGGYSYGPRFFTDMAPYLVYFLIPVVALFTGPCRQLRPAVLLFAVLALISFVIHYRGATDSATLEWNVAPISVDSRPERLWDWYDLQFTRGIPALDPLIPPRVIVQPGNVTIWGAKAKGGHITLRLFDGRYRGCDWTIEAPPGVMASVNHVDNARDTSLTLTVGPQAFANGAQTIGELVVSASRTGANRPLVARVALPLQVRVVERAIFLPLITR